MVPCSVDALETETREGWVAVLASVRALGANRFRAEVRLPSAAPLATARLRYGGKPVRHVLIETKASSRPRVAIAVIEFELEVSP